MSKKCSCPFDTPAGADRVAIEDGWTVTYCWQCRGLISAVKFSAADAVTTASLSKLRN